MFFCTPTAWNLLRIICTVIILTTFGCGRMTPEEKKAKYLERADQYMEQGQYPEAIIEYKNVVQLDPTNGTLHYQLALAHLKLGTRQNLQQAFDELTRVVELDKTNLDAQLKLGALYLLGREPAKARERAEIVLASSPQNAEGLILRGRSLLSELRYQEAVAELKKAIELSPQNVHISIELARAYVALHENAAAEATLNQALTVNPRSVDVLLVLADFRILMGKPEQAEAIYKRTIEITPESETVYLKLAGYYQGRGKLAEADATLQQLAARTPQADTPQIYLGDYYTSTGQLDKALMSYRRATEIAPSSTNARDKLITHYLDTGKIADAEPLVNALREKDSHDTMGRFFDARIKLAHSLPNEALTTLQHVVKDHPQFAPAHYFLGVAYLQRHELPQARAAMADAVKFNPLMSEARTALAQIHLKEGSLDLALEQAQAAIQINPRNVQAALLTGTAYLRKGDLAKSRKVFEAIAHALPNEPLGPYNLGLVAQAEKNTAKALAYFEEALTRRSTAFEPMLQIVAIKSAQGKTQEARERVLKQLEAAPKNPLLHNLVGQLWIHAKDPAQAEKAFKTAIDLDGTALAPYLNLAQLYYQTGRVHQAITEYDNAHNKNPNDPTALMMSGIIYEGRKEYDKAKAHYEQILKINPRFAPAANNLAWVLAEQGGNLDVALTHAQIAREQRSEDPNVADTLGWIYFKKNAYLLAVSLLKEAADKLPNEPLVHYHLGMAQSKKGDTVAAKQALQTALKLNQHFPGAEEAKKTVERL